MPLAAAATIPSVSRPTALGSAPASTSQARDSSARRRRVGDRAAAGQQVGQAAGVHRAAVAGPARHPREAGAGAAGEGRRGGQSARHGGQALADDQQGAGRAERGGDRRVLGQQPGLLAGRGRHESRADLAKTPGEVRCDGA